MPTPIAASSSRSFGATRAGAGVCARKTVGAAADAAATVCRNSRRVRRIVMMASLRDERQAHRLAAELRRPIRRETDLHRLLCVEHAGGGFAIVEDAGDQLVDLRLERMVNDV